MNKLMALIAIVFGLVLVTYQAKAATIQRTTPSKAISVESEVLLVASNWADSRFGRKFQIRADIRCRTWNHGSPALTDELSKHFSSQHQRNIKRLRREGVNFAQLCSKLSSVKTKKQARSWLAKGTNIASKFVKYQNYWIRNPSRWSNAEEARIWYAFNCRRDIGRVAQATAEVISENKPRSAARAEQKAQSIKARASNICSRGYDGNEEKFMSENRGLFNSFLSLYRLSK